MAALDAHDAAEAFLDVAVLALDTLPDEDVTLDGAPARRYVAAGTPVVDCDQVVVWMPTIDEVDTAPDGNQLAVGLRGQMGRVNLPSYTLMVVRCVPALPKQGRSTAPAVEVLSAAAKQTNADAWVCWCGINTARKQGRFNDLCSSVAVGRATAMQTSGGLGGWQLPIYVQLDGYQVPLGS